MNSYYKKPVVAIGMVVPLLVILALLMGTIYGFSKLNKSYQGKKLAYKKAEIARQNTMTLQGKVGQNNLVMKQWQNMLATETRGTFIDHWKSAEQKFKGNELTRSPHNWINYSEGMGKGVNQASSQVSMDFSATYRAMQLTLMEVETKLPQMQLDSIIMKPEKNGGRINFSTQFTVWTQK